MTVEEFGQFIYLLRISKDLSLYEASRKAGVDRYLLDKIERGISRSFPRHKTLSNLARFYEFRFQHIPEQLLVIIPPSFGDRIIREFKDSGEEREITIKEGEIILIKRALRQTNFNREKTAKVLGMGERTLYRKLKKYGLIEE